MISANLLIGTAAGAIIGGITNGIAIKMLFRPLNPVKIGNYTLPFTPGVIPKERKRIASKVGQVISEELLNEEVLRAWLLKKEAIDEIDKMIESYFNKLNENERTIGELLDETMGKERSTYLVCEIEEGITAKLYSKVMSMEIGKIIVSKMQDAFKEGKFGSLLGPMSFFINESLIESIASKIEPIISGFIEDEGEGIIRKAIEKESEEVLSSEVKEMAEKLSPYHEIIKHSLLKAYEKIVNEHLAGILKGLKIDKIVEDRILALDMLEVERIILDIMHKELNAIIWFGVALGAIMGILASLI